MNKFKSRYEDEYNKLIDALTDEISESPSKNEPHFNDEETSIQGVVFSTKVDNHDYDIIREVIR